MSFQRIVAKLGTSTLTAGTPHLSPPRIVELVRQMSELRAAGREVILVTSGAIAAGRAHLGFPQLSGDIPAKQMLAAVGQPRLMSLYEQLFGLYGVLVAQVLITRADISDRRRYLNSRGALLALLAHHILPIVNENDTVATEEIRVGDNDNLSALVANLVEADLLILLTDQPGLLTANPRRDPTATLIRDVTSPDIPDELWRAAGGTGTGLGVGGMFTKVQAADLARRSGATVIIARGSDPDILSRIVSGEPLGTRFSPVTTVESRKRYLLAGVAAPGCIQVDPGAAAALRASGSLLPVGVQSITGAFDRGDVVRVVDPAGREIARGLTNYADADLLRIRGKQSQEIETLLGYTFADEVIHRNNMVLL
ncbi:MAG: glutamate 5-kinase [Anaerolineae bacterium]